MSKGLFRRICLYLQSALRITSDQLLKLLPPIRTFASHPVELGVEDDRNTDVVPEKYWPS
jgi:hypothetical protein